MDGNVLKSTNVFSSWSELIIGVPRGSVLIYLLINVLQNSWN